MNKLMRLALMKKIRGSGDDNQPTPVVYLTEKGMLKSDYGTVMLARLYIYESNGTEIANFYSYEEEQDLSGYFQKGKRYYCILEQDSDSIRSNTVTYVGLGDVLVLTFNSTAVAALSGDKQFDRLEWELYSQDDGQVVAEHTGTEKTWDCSDYIRPAEGYTYTVRVKAYLNGELVESLSATYQFN